MRLFRRASVKKNAEFSSAGKFPLFLLTFIFLNFASAGAAPLERGFALAPAASASPDEKMRAFEDARNRVIATAAQYERTPYRYGGIDRNGLDCSGLVYASFKDALGVSTPRSTLGLYEWVEKIAFDKAQAGDLLFFKTDTFPLPNALPKIQKIFRPLRGK